MSAEARRARSAAGRPRRSRAAPRAGALEVALVAGDGGARGLGPDLHVGVAGSPRSAVSARDMSTRVSACSGQLTDAAGPLGRVGRRLVERRDQDRAGLVEMAAGDGLGAPVVGERARGLADEEHGVPEAGERGRDPSSGRVDRGAAGVAEGQQVRRRGCRCRRSTRSAARSGRSVAGVVPVVEVAPEALEAAACVARVASSRSTSVEQSRASRSRARRRSASR